ncbi:MAG: aspartate--tRNA(Asn) ligase [Methanomicrobium sp.]|uniref:aspartate--tRNA(Asn) ligase n=1 Tax=Methanomicrobium mobile TaxID=2205 RepID=UPI0005B2DFFE|nr:aspartate--tRNA(Asn) ligase [Methanomicrobium mobile]MBP5083352.1 aspartate--tRNA(Asn) ligase [Methanomicrobium sp.]
MRLPISEVKPDTGTATVIGWIHEIRDLGGLSFYILRDRTGFLQATIVKKKAGEDVLAAAKEASRESVVKISGVVKESDKAPGGREIIPEKFEIISKAETPLPLDVSEKVPAEIDTRLDNRYLDARRPKVAAIFRIRSEVTHAISDYFYKNGFINITTSKIVAAATEGGTELFPIAYFEKEAFLNQSPQLYKQMMMGAGFEKVFEIGPIFRAEEHNTTKHLNEATSIDVEVSFADHNDVMALLEKVINVAYEAVAENCQPQLDILGTKLQMPSKTFPKLPYADAIDIAAGKIDEDIKYGDDLSSNAERAIGSEMGEHYFITDWPRSIKPFYAMPYEDRPDISKAFDMMHPKMELSSGAQRVHQYDLLVEQIKLKGLNPDNFEFYLKPFKYGMPPHAGWGVGMDRLITTMLDLPNIREGVLFPRDRHRVTP